MTKKDEDKILEKLKLHESRKMLARIYNTKKRLMILAAENEVKFRNLDHARVMKRGSDDNILLMRMDGWIEGAGLFLQRRCI